jgi:hypothetical protein
MWMLTHIRSKWHVLMERGGRIEERAKAGEREGDGVTVKRHQTKVWRSGVRARATP